MEDLQNNPDAVRGGSKAGHDTMVKAEASNGVAKTMEGNHSSVLK